MSKRNAFAKRVQFKETYDLHDVCTVRNAKYNQFTFISSLAL